MAFKKTYALIKGEWLGSMEDSDFVQDPSTYDTVEEFLEERHSMGIVWANEASVNQGNTVLQQEFSSDGKTLITTVECDTEEIFNYWFSDNIKVIAQSQRIKYYDVEVAPSPQFIDLFDESLRIYYHSSAHLF